MEKLVGIIKSTAPAPGYDEVLVAGDPEWRIEKERVRNGIPIADGNWDQLLRAAASVGVTPPALS
jgi:LDH2 family malate/lactate/ureidoglycolate dehydrogenase